MDFLIRGSEYLARFPDFKLVGRKAELDRLVSILMQRRANSVIIVGEGGVGTTALCLGVQERKQDPDAPFDLVNKRLFWLDTNELFSAGDTTGVTKSFHRILAHFSRTVEPVLLLDDARDFVEACRNNGALHLINALLSAVRAKRCQVILEVRDHDLDMVLKCHSDLRDLFTLLPIEEPAGQALLDIVTAAADGLSKHHGIKVLPDAITTSIELTTKYRTQDGLNRALPERSITLLDRALASYRLSSHKAPPGISPGEWEETKFTLLQIHKDQREGEIAIAKMEDEIETIRQRESKETRELAGFELPEVSKIRTNILKLQGIVKASRDHFSEIARRIDSALALTRDHVLTEFSDISGIPTSKLGQNELSKLKDLEAALGRRIFGQEAVVARVAAGVKVARVGRRSDRPLAFLFLGPSGVGKTELSKVLAGALLDDEAALTRFDMSEYMEKHAVAKLIGAPPGYEGFDVGGILTNAMRRSSYRVLLFDEIEKAHPDVFNIMLQVLGDGRLTDNVGRTVSFADAIIVMTTNIGQIHFLDDTTSEEKANEAALADLDDTYRSEFLNRFAGRQNIICFRRLGIDSMAKIVTREISSLNSSYSPRGVDVTMTPNHILAFCTERYDPKVGARGLPGYIQANLEPQVVDKILDGQENCTAIVTHKLEVLWTKR